MRIWGIKDWWTQTSSWQWARSRTRHRQDVCKSRRGWSDRGCGERGVSIVRCDLEHTSSGKCIWMACPLRQGSRHWPPWVYLRYYVRRFISDLISVKQGKHRTIQANLKLWSVQRSGFTQYPSLLYKMQK